MVHQPSVRFFLPTKEVSIKSIYALTKLILLSSSKVLLLLVHSTWGTDRSNEPRRPCPGVPLLPAKPNFHPTSPPPSLPNHRNRREDIRFPLRNRSLLCAKQSIWDWWSLPRDHPVYSALANGPRHCPSAGLHRVEHWVGCTGNEGLRGCASSPIFFHLRSAMTSSHARLSTIFAKPSMTQTLIMGCGSLSLTLTPMGIGSCLSYMWTR